MAIQIKLRRDQSSIWDSDNPVLLAGEMAFQYDSGTSQVGRFKIGNGSREWSRLPYFYAYQDSAGLYPSSGGGGVNSSTWYGDRALKMGGMETSGYTQSNIIEYWSMTSAGNAIDFGDLSVARGGSNADGGTGNGTYGMNAGGVLNADPWYSNVIDYVTIATTGNAADWGDLLFSGYSGCTSNGAIALMMGDGGNVNTNGTTIQQWSLTTAGNATDFGDLNLKSHSCSACSNATRAVRMGGWENGSYTAGMQYVTYASASNSTSFGNLTAAAANDTATSDTTRGVRFAGQTTTNNANIDYITIASTGNATDFGDITAYRKHSASCSNATVAHVFGGESYSGGFVFWNNIETITIQTAGNATDFGDLLATQDGMGGTAGDAS